MEYSRLVESIVDGLLEVEVLPDAFVTKAADGSWEKKEAAPGTVSPLSRSGIRSPRVNMGMKTPTTTFLPYAGLSPAVKEVRARSGDPSVRVVPSEDQSFATLVKTAPKAQGTPLFAKLSNMTPQEFTDTVGQHHLIGLGPTKKHLQGVEGQTAVFGHEAGHILNKDTARRTSSQLGFAPAQSEDEQIASEEKAWDTGEALLKDMGLPYSPSVRRPALYTYYSGSKNQTDKADVTQLERPETKTLFHMLMQQPSITPHRFRLGNEIHTSPGHFLGSRMRDIVKKSTTESVISEVTLPKYMDDWNHTSPETVAKLDKAKEIAHNAWARELEKHALPNGDGYDTLADNGYPHPKLAALSDNLVYFDRLRSAADLRGGKARPAHHEIARQATDQQLLTRMQSAKPADWDTPEPEPESGPSAKVLPYKSRKPTK